MDVRSPPEGPLFRAAFEQAPHGMALLTPEGTYVSVNRRYASMIGQDASAIVGRAWADVAPPEDRARADGYRARIEAEGFAVGVERHRRPDGTVVVGEVSMSLVRGDDGTPQWVLLQVVDRTEQDQTERLRQEADGRTRGALDALPFGLAVLDGGLDIVRMNPAGCAILGYDEAELVGRHVSAFLPPDDPKPLTRRMDGKPAWSDGSGAVDRRYLHRDGTTRWARVWAGALAGETWAGEAHVVLFIDVTEDRRRADDHDLLEEQLRLAQRLEAVGRLAGGIAHDFNNMLAVILNSASFARQRTTYDPRVVEHLDTIHNAATRSIGLARQLMILGRQDAAPPEVLDLNAVVRDFAPLLRKTLGEDVILEAHLDPTIDAVRLPPSHIEQVLMNLAVNARDAMPDGGHVRVRTLGRHASDDHHVLLVVEDDGSGIPAEVQARMFEPFFTTKGQGTGLGLSIVWSIVHKAGGTLIVESKPGRGSRFEIALPAVSRPPDETSSEEDLDLPAGHGERVLLVEDEPALLSMVRQILEEFGYQVEPFGDPEAALAWLRGTNQPPDLLLTDVIMPNLSGADLAAAATRARPGLKVLFMSGHTADRLSRLRLDGGIAFLHKPFQAADLLNAVRAALLRG